jgi:hypothetical protein
MHLPPSESPEYAVTTDVNYDLALFKWGCTTLLYITRELLPAHKNDPQAVQWQDVVDNLVSYPVDKQTGTAPLSIR